METVILLHGLGRSSTSMRYMALRLQWAGFDTVTLDYPSREAGIAELVDGLFRRLPKAGRLHMVGHSLGGVLAKHLMLRLPPQRRGRIVQLGAPNFGSEIAETVDFLAPVMGPALEDLRPNGGIDDSGLDIGAIAGTAAPEALGRLTGIEGENDGKVSVKSAWGNAPEGKRIKLPVAHSVMMLNRDVIAATVKFLREGRF
ncbi:MAG: esterase/lipase family protein [Paracoccaceae bacterium]